MTTTETIVAMAIKHKGVLDQLGTALRSDLVLPNPLYRQIVSFADDFLTDRRKMPLAGDYDLWLGAIPEAQRDGIRESLGRIQGTDTSEYHPDFFAENVLPELKTVAAHTAHSRMAEMGMDSITPEILHELSERVESVALTTGDLDRKLSVADILKMPRSSWIVDDLLREGSLSLLAGPPKSGKSTLARHIALAISGHGPSVLFDRVVHPGRVLLVSPDEDPAYWVQEQHQLGIIPGDCDTIDIVQAASLSRICSELRTGDYVFVTLDTLGRISPESAKGNGDAYSGWIKTFGKLRDAATVQKSHVMVLHHTRKAGGSHGAQVLGSQGIYGSVDLAMTLSFKGNGENPDRILKCEQARMGIRRFPTSRVEYSEDGELILTPVSAPTTIQDRLLEKNERINRIRDMRNEGLKDTEIAETLGVTPRTVRNLAGPRTNGIPTQ